MRMIFEGGVSFNGVMWCLGGGLRLVTFLLCLSVLYKPSYTFEIIEAMLGLDTVDPRSVSVFLIPPRS